MSVAMAAPPNGKAHRVPPTIRWCVCGGRFEAAAGEANYSRLGVTTRRPPIDSRNSGNREEAGTESLEWGTVVKEDGDEQINCKGSTKNRQITVHKSSDRFRWKIE